MSKRLIFGHIVNHREPKGTRFVLAAVHAARMRGADFGFVFAERLSHQQALEIYAHIDVLLEQFVIGWYGLQACEVAMMGKPIVVWIDNNVKDNVPEDFWQAIPFINTQPTELVDTIMALCKKPIEEIEAIGAKGPDFVRRFHGASLVAQQMLKDLG